MNYLDLFSGIGGFALGFQRAGWTFDKHYYSEIDKYATQIYQKHFPNAIGLGDVSKINGAELGQVDLITFGFPCQDLSIAGRRAGLGGSRSGLFFEAARLVRELKPGLFIFENVKGLLTSNKRQDFETVLREIADIGLYDCEWQLLNTSWFLPQNRERVYFIGHLAGTGGRKVFPIGESKNIYNETPKTKKEAYSNSLPLTAKGQMNWTGDFIIKRKDKKIRRLTPVECERLQGFPDGWTEGISESQRYKCLGNAVSVPVVEAITGRLKKEVK